MAMKDLESSLKASTALNIAAISSDTTTDGNAIDMQGFESVMAAYHSGAYTDGTYTPLVLEGDTNVVGAATPVADADLLPSGTGQEASAAISAANTTTKIGYRGTKRYVFFSVVSTSTSSGATVGATAIQGHASEMPVS